MKKDSRWAIVGCLCGCLSLWAAPSWAHELTFVGKLFAPADISDMCIGNLIPSGGGDDDDDVVERVDLEDYVALTDAFGDACPQPEDTEHCPMDLNHNHRIGDGDLRVLVGNWGPCRYRADVNADGLVDLDDAALVAAANGLDCRPDLDWNGRVEGNDFHLAQMAWGPGDDLQGNVDGDLFLEIVDDLLAVFGAMDRQCDTDVDLNRFVDCDDLNHVCRKIGADCCDLYVGICPEMECEE